MRFFVTAISLAGVLMVPGCASCKSDYEWLLRQKVGIANPEQMRMWLLGMKMQVIDKSEEGIMMGDNGLVCKAVLRFENGVLSSYGLEGNKCYHPRPCLLQ